jgi:hypothetical protein
MIGDGQRIAVAVVAELELAFEVGELSDDDMARLEVALRPEAVSGPRYNERLIAWVDR